MVVRDLFQTLKPGTMITAEDMNGYIILNEPFDNLTSSLPPYFMDRPIVRLSAGYKAIHFFATPDVEEYEKRYSTIPEGED